MFEKFEKNKDISHLTTFGIPAIAKLYAEYESVKDLIRISRSSAFQENEVLHIGGGSNLLFVNDFNGIVLHSGIKGIKKYVKNENEIYVIAGAGEKWSDLVDFCIAENLGGLENLAGIPGEVGASAVQNVGAYGAEAADFIYAVECFDITTRETVTLKAAECGYGYRNSKFKHDWKGRYFVLRVSYKLRNSDIAQNIEYGPLKKLAQQLGRTPYIKEVADKVISTRDSKLPNPAVIGNAGSFFKNPVVSRYFYENLILPDYPDCPAYDVDELRVKLPAGWLIEHAGLKGYKIGGAEVYPKQCLVLANTGNASAKDVVALANHVQHTVKEKFNVLLRPEVNFIDDTIKVTILGSGTSRGVPEMACNCRVCSSNNPKDKRLRASILVETNGVRLLVDASPDLRQQALDNKIDFVDAVLLTHQHYDHVGGIDDLRPFCNLSSLPIYLTQKVNSDLHRRLEYCFSSKPYPGVPHFDMKEIDFTPFLIDGVKIIPIEVMHGNMPIVGYRIGDFAYITDCKTLPEKSKELLKNLKVLVLNALRPNPHFAHLSFSEARELIDELKPEVVYLTHFCHEAGLHNEIDSEFPKNVHPAFDGQQIIIG